MRRVIGLIATFVLFGTVAASAQPNAAATGSQCFFIRNFEGWKAPDAKTIYIRVDPHDYYRLDLSASCPALLWPDSHLITKWRGSSSVCSPLDWDLKVAQSPPGGMVEPCIVKAMTKLTPAEADAIPKKFKP